MMIAGKPIYISGHSPHEERGILDCAHLIFYIRTGLSNIRSVTLLFCAVDCSTILLAYDSYSIPIKILSKLCAESWKYFQRHYSMPIFFSEIHDLQRKLFYWLILVWFYKNRFLDALQKFDPLSNTVSEIGPQFKKLGQALHYISTFQRMERSMTLLRFGQLTSRKNCIPTHFTNLKIYQFFQICSELSPRIETIHPERIYSYRTPHSRRVWLSLCMLSFIFLCSSAEKPVSSYTLMFSLYCMNVTTTAARSSLDSTYSAPTASRPPTIFQRGTGERPIPSSSPHNDVIQSNRKTMLPVHLFLSSHIASFS